MLLRPATPLAILFLVAFVLLLLATLSTPIIKAIPLASFGGIDFGVFGYCQGSTCSGIRVGYSTESLFDSTDENDFSLPSSARHSLSSILIVHPIAALLTLICFALAVAAHFQRPAHSPRYLLALLILTFPTLLVALLAFLVDILLFVPHMAWGGWIVLAATILIIASGVVTCAMRRTLVSRKARKKRIAENADMNGQNYYESMQQPPRMLADELPRADSPPPMSGGIEDNSKMPQYATFETNALERKTSEDRTPLNPRAHSIRSASSVRQPQSPLDIAPPPMPGQYTRDPPRDQYGNIISPGEVAMANQLPPPGLRHHASRGSLGSNASGRSQRSAGQGGAPYMGPNGGPPPPGYRGRGGYAGPPRGRGGYGPRGNFGPGPRGGYGPGRGGPMQYRGRGGPQGMRGLPPPGWQGPPPMGRGMQPGPGGMSAVPIMAGGAQGLPPGYGAPPYSAEAAMSPPGLPPFASRNASPAPQMDDNTIGQAIEMDERTGSPPVQAPVSPVDLYSIHNRDGDVPAPVRTQQPGRDITPVNQRQVSGNEPPTPSSIYSQQTYVPARNKWAPPVPMHAPVSPINTSHAVTTNGGDLSPIPASPGSRHRRTGSDVYYEDVDPRFAVDPEPMPTIGAAHASPPRLSILPNSLTPGPQGPMGPQYLTVDDGHAHGASSVDQDSTYDIAEGARSPAGSDVSHFTSVSQRGVNPNWRPPMGMGGPGYGPGSAIGQRRNERSDMILGANPDFSIPGMGPPTRGGLGPRGRGAPMNLRSSPGVGGLTPQGRYPTDL